MVWSIHLPGDGGFVQLKLPVFWSVNYRFKTWHLKLNTKTEISVRGTLYTSVGICDDIAAHAWLSDLNSSQNKKGIELCLPDFLSLRFFSVDQAPKYNPLELQNHCKLVLAIGTRANHHAKCVNFAIGHVWSCLCPISLSEQYLAIHLEKNVVVWLRFRLRQNSSSILMLRSSVHSRMVF